MIKYYHVFFGKPYIGKTEFLQSNVVDCINIITKFETMFHSPFLYIQMKKDLMKCVSNKDVVGYKQILDKAFIGLNFAADLNNYLLSLEDGANLNWGSVYLYQDYIYPAVWNRFIFTELYKDPKDEQKILSELKEKGIHSCIKTIENLNVIYDSLCRVTPDKRIKI